MAYVKGDYKAVCDVCGFVKLASQMKKRWDGAFVCEKDWEPRHPLDQIRYTFTDKQSVPIARPEPEYRFLAENEITADDL